MQSLQRTRGKKVGPLADIFGEKISSEEHADHDRQRKFVPCVSLRGERRVFFKDGTKERKKKRMRKSSTSQQRNRKRDRRSERGRERERVTLPILAERE